MFVAKNYTLVSGSSNKDQFELLSFDNSLINANVNDYNLVRISSILPAGCCYRPQIDLCKGSILYIAYSSLTKIGTGVISSAIAVGIPKEKHNIGVIMEYSDLKNKECSINIAEKMVRMAMEKRNIIIKEILSIGSETELSTDSFSTTFAGLAIW